MKTKTLIISLALVTIATATASANPNLLVNPSFEGNHHNNALLCQHDSICSVVEYDNVRSPTGWLFWFVHEEPCADGWLTGQPESRVVGLIPDPWRVSDGAQAFEFFTVWRCHRAGLLQQVHVAVDVWYRASVDAHAWYSQCAQEPHGPRLEHDCRTLLTWANDYLRVGIDPSGGTDPRSPSVVWGAPTEVYGVYGRRVYSPAVRTTGAWATVFVESRTTHPLDKCNAYVDDAELRAVTWVRLVLVSREGR